MNLSFVFVFFILYQPLQANEENLALNKPVYVKGVQSGELKNLVDGKPGTSCNLDFPLVIVVDLEDYYNIEYIRVITTADAKMEYFNVGFLGSFDKNYFENFFNSNKKCGTAGSHIPRNQPYRLNCNKTRVAYRWVSLWKIDNSRYVELSEFEVFGSRKKDDVSLHYKGCYQVGNETNIKKNSSLQACSIFCLKNSFFLFGVKGGDDCVCLKDLKNLVPSSDCDMLCPGSNDTCGGSSAMSVYQADRPPTNVLTYVLGGVTLVLVIALLVACVVCIVKSKKNRNMIEPKTDENIYANTIELKNERKERFKPKENLNETKSKQEKAPVCFENLIYSEVVSNQPEEQLYSMIQK